MNFKEQDFFHLCVFKNKKREEEEEEEGEEVWRVAVGSFEESTFDKKIFIVPWLSRCHRY